MKYPNTYMATTSDLGGGLHPKHKSGYGGREARVALAAVYGRKNTIYGPIYQSYTIEGDKLRVKFSNIAQGLVFKGGDRLQGFAIAGADQKFYWADAVIDGDTVTVSSSSVPKPVAVRYAWSALIPSANLFSQDGLPALTFRTDTWPMPPPPGFPKKSSSSTSPPTDQ
jgi:sialate O-acetylesterase